MCDSHGAVLWLILRMWTQDKKRAQEATDRLGALEAELASVVASRDAAVAKAEAAEQESKSIVKRQNELEKVL